jgi:hypothetical protein
MLSTRRNPYTQLFYRLQEFQRTGIPFEKLVYKQTSFDGKITPGGVEIRYQRWLGKTIDTCVTVIERYDEFGRLIDEDFYPTPPRLRLQDLDKSGPTHAPE